MPAEFVKCVKTLMDEGKDKNSAYAICTAQYKKRHNGKTPQSADSSYYEQRDLMCMNSIISTTESNLSNTYYLVDSAENEELKFMLSDMVSTMQTWTEKTATLRNKLYPTYNPAQAGIDEYTLLAKEDAQLRLAVYLMDKEYQP
jgi:hypothetical protein